MNRKPWPEGKVFYVFDKDYPQFLRIKLLAAMDKIMKEVPCVHFIPADPVMMESTARDNDIVVFTFKAAGYVGSNFLGTFGKNKTRTLKCTG